MKVFSLVMVFLAACSLSVHAQETTAGDSPPLPSNVIARINGTDIPAEWFLHEFRSSFFKHMNEDDARTATLAPFLKRMIMVEQARASGIVDRPEVQEEIRRRIDGMRAYMEYQLAMTEIGIINQALVEDLKLSKSPDDVTQEELDQFFETNIKGEAGAPDSIDALPPQALDSIRKQIVMTVTEKELSILIETWKKDMAIEINEEAVQSIPMPEMKGALPPH